MSTEAQITEQEAKLGRLPFYLTQRLRRRDYPGGTGFDAAFLCEYMGSAEFEWGAIPESLSRIRSVANRKLVVHVGKVSRNRVTAPVYVVGHRDRVPFVPDALTTWMADPWPHGKERSHFPEQVDGTANEYQRCTHAWWALRSDVMWALDADTADLLLAAVRTRPERKSR